MFKKIASNTFSQIFSKVATGIIAIFLISLLTKYLSVEMYGMYTKIYNYTGIFVFLADLGLYAISIREITNNSKDSNKIVGNVMTLRLILGIFILILSTIIALFLPGYNSNLALISIIVCSIFTIVQLINSSILSLMQANMKIEFSAISLIIGKLINLGGIAFVAYILFPKGGEGDNAFIAIMVVGVIWVVVNTLLNYFYAKKITSISFKFDYEYIKYLFKISLPYGIALFLSVIYFKVDVILLSLLEGPKLGDLSIALYSLPMKIVEVIMVIGGFYMTSILPSLSKGFRELVPTFSQGKGEEQTPLNPPLLRGEINQAPLLDKEEIDQAPLLDRGEMDQVPLLDKEGVGEVFLQQLISISFKVLFGFAFVVFSLGILFRDYIIRIIANDDYIFTDTLYNSSDAFLVVFGVILFYFVSLVFIYTLVAAEKQSKLLRINIFVTIFNIVGNIILIPKYSFIGAGITTILSQILLCILGYYYTNKLVLIKLPIFFILRVILFGSLISLFGYYLLNNFSLGLYLDFVIYGCLLGGMYLGYFFMEYKVQRG